MLAHKIRVVEDQCKVMSALAEELSRTLADKRAVEGIEICRAMLRVMTAEDSSKLVMTQTSLSSVLDFLSGLMAQLAKFQHPQHLCLVFELLASLVQREALDEAVVLRLVDSCLIPIFSAVATVASFASKVVVAVFDRYEQLQTSILESCISRQWPFESKPTFRLLPPCKGMISEASALMLDLLRGSESCSSVVSTMNSSAELRPALAVLLSDAGLCLGVHPNSCNLLMAASAKLAHSATQDAWSLETLGTIVASIASVVASSPVEKSSGCGVCLGNISTFSVTCSRCQQPFHGACVSVTDDRVLTLTSSSNNLVAEDENSVSQQHEIWCCRACVVRQHPISQSNTVFLNVILSALKEKSSKIRVRAVRCLAALALAHPKLVNERADVIGAVRSRFFDQNVSVREAAVDFAGQMSGFLLFDEIVDRSRDTGVSVRKRAVRVLSQVLSSLAATTAQRQAALVALAYRLDDEKSVKVLARQAFERAWFSQVPVSAEVVKEMAAVTKLANGSVWFVPLVKKLIKHAILAKKKAVGISSVCESLCDALVEQSSGEAISVLRLLVDVVPAHMAQYLHKLRANCLALATADVVHIMDRIMAQSVDFYEFELLEQLEVDMVKIIYNHAETAVVASAVRCLVNAVRITKHARIMCDLYAKLYGFLFQSWTFAQAGKLSEDRHPALIRALFTVGNLMRWFDFDASDFIPSMVSTPHHAIKKGELHVRVLRICIFFGERAVPSLQSRAIEAAGNLCARNSEFLVMCSSLLRKVLKPVGQPPDVLSRALAFLLQFLQEEKRVHIEHNKSLKQVKEEKPEPKTEGDRKDLDEEEGNDEPEEDFYDGTASVSATVINEHWPAVLDLVTFVSDSGADASVRGAAVALVAEALAQGLVLATSAVAPLVASQLDGGWFFFRVLFRFVFA